MKTEVYDIEVSRISENRANTRIHRWEMLRYDGRSPIEVGLTVNFGERRRSNTVTLTLTATYTAMRGILMRPLLNYSIDVEFEVPNLRREAMVTETSIYLPPEMLRIMLNISIGAIRGMLSLRTEGTPLANHPLPIYSIASLLSHLQATA